MRVVVTGSRDWPENEPQMITALLDGLFADAVMGHLVTEVMSEFHLYAGENPHGVDKIAKWWAEQSPTHSYNEREDDPLFQYHPHPADWDRWGKQAGPLRNAAMLRDAGGGLVVAFHASRDHYLNLDRKGQGKSGESGTNHCASLARKMGTFEIFDVVRRASQ